MLGVATMAPLLAQPELLDQRPIAVGIARLEIIEKLAPPRDHAKQAATRMVILHVRLEVIVQTVDARGQQRYLHLGRAGIALRSLVFGDDLRLFGNRDGHEFLVRSSPWTRGRL